MAVWLIIGNCTPTSITAKTNSKFSMQKGQKYRFSNIKCHMEWREIAWCKNICLQEYIKLCSIVLNNKQKTIPYWGWCTKAFLGFIETHPSVPQSFSPVFFGIILYALEFYGILWHYPRFYSIFICSLVSFDIFNILQCASIFFNFLWYSFIFLGILRYS